MAKITGLPNTCSAYYLSEVSEMDDIKNLVAEHLKARAGNTVHKSACCYFTSVVRPPVIKKLEEAGFIKTSGYYSHRHARNVTFMMMRPTSKLEWDSGKAAFPKPKAKRKNK